VAAVLDDMSHSSERVGIEQELDALARVSLPLACCVRDALLPPRRAAARMVVQLLDDVLHRRLVVSV